ncbi:hypothetical protein ACQJBY_003708 [Aegilops geniculata]
MRAYVNVTMAVVLLIGCLAAIGQLGRVEAGRSYREGRQADGEASKLALKICVRRDCETKAEPLYTSCFCCMSLPKMPCYFTRDECKAECPYTGPRALPASAVGNGTAYAHEQMDGK